MKSIKRTRRIADLIQHQLAMALKKEINDPRVQDVVITSVDVSPDLANAKIYFTVLDPSKVADTNTGLQKASGYLRSLLARSTALRFVPKLHFIFDETLQRAERVSQLINQAITSDDESTQNEADTYEPSDKDE